MMNTKTFAAFLAVGGLVAAGTLYASGGGTPGTPPGKGGDETTTPNSAEIKISSMTAPAGGTAQITFATTSPQPILSGGTGFSAFLADGVALNSPLGDSAGVALQKDGRIQVFAISPQADLGTGDYPFLTVTMSVPQGLQTGAVFPVDLSGTSMINAAGPIAISSKAGAITIGGTYSISEVRPGGGTYPGGTVVRVLGQGFQANMSLHTQGFQINSFTYVSPNEIDCVLKETTKLDGQLFQIANGGAVQSFLSYLRGQPLQPPSRSYLKNIDPMFQQLTHAIAQAGPFAAETSAQYVALALQNPNPGPAAATLTITHGNGTASSTLIVLPSGSRVVDSLAALAGLNVLASGDVLSLTSTAAIQILGINVDESANTATPFLPSF